MTANTSSAVMQRRNAGLDQFDYFGTPAWATRSLMRYLIEGPAQYCQIPLSTVIEPACGQGHMSRPLGEYFKSVVASDIQDFGFGEVHDFLFPTYAKRAEWVITNPPFVLAEEFIEKSMDLCSVGCAFLVRSAFAESKGRYERLFSVNPPNYRLQFVERVVMSKGAPRDPKLKYLCETTGKMKRPYSATSYEWMVWFKDNDRPTIADWLGYPVDEMTLPRDYIVPELNGIAKLTGKV